MTAHRAFQFCKQYKRTTEFRRLCEIIRNHLANLNKYRDQRDRPDLSAPESLQLYLDTRFEQLKIATELELWQVSEFLWTFSYVLILSTKCKICQFSFEFYLSQYFYFLFAICRKHSVLLKIFMDWCAWLRKLLNHHWWWFTMPNSQKFFGFLLATSTMLMHGSSYSRFKKVLTKT